LVYKQMHEVIERLGFGHQRRPWEPVAGVAQEPQRRAQVPRFIVVHPENGQLASHHAFGVERDGRICGHRAREYGDALHVEFV